MLGPIMIDLKEDVVSLEEEAILKHSMVGGVVLFFKNCKSVDQLKQLIAKIRELRSEILIAVDREGGNVQRFQKPGFRCFPAARIYGEIYDNTHGKSDYWIEFTNQYAGKIGDELSSLDIDINLAPVLDTHNDNEVIGGLDRAFHADPIVRTKIAEVFTKELQNKGIKTTGKHFPDHGVGMSDSHKTKPISNIDKETLFKEHLMPYRKLIETNNLDIIMPAHITYTSVDANNPAGFSKIWLNDILRKELGFKGAIFSDCLSMEGANVGNIKDRITNTLAEGCCDMALVCNQDRKLLLDTLDDLEKDKAFKQNTESQARLEKLVRRKNQVQITTEGPSPMLRFSKVDPTHIPTTSMVPVKEEPEKLKAVL